MKAIEDAVAQLQAIADKNNDKFSYSIEIEPRRKEFLYTFRVKETADQHTFVCGSGYLIESAVASAQDDIDAACAEWGYKQ